MRVGCVVINTFVCIVCMVHGGEVVGLCAHV